MKTIGRTVILALCLVALAAAPRVAAEAPRTALAREVLPGPVAATVLKVLDGDTLMVRARIWVGQDLEIKVRLAGVDAPELRGRCDKERALARKARDFARARVASGKVYLHLIQYGKFAGRVLARVEPEAGGDLGAALIAAGLARAYDGGKRLGWCD